MGVDSVEIFHEMKIHGGWCSWSCALSFLFFFSFLSFFFFFSYFEKRTDRVLSLNQAPLALFSSKEEIENRNWIPLSKEHRRLIVVVRFLEQRHCWQSRNKIHRDVSSPAVSSVLENSIFISCLASAALSEAFFCSPFDRICQLENRLWRRNGNLNFVAGSEFLGTRSLAKKVSRIGINFVRDFIRREARLKLHATPDLKFLNVVL